MPHDLPVLGLKFPPALAQLFRPDLAQQHWERQTFVWRDFTAAAHVIRMKIFQMSYGGVIGKMEIYGFGPAPRPRPLASSSQGSAAAVGRQRERKLSRSAEMEFQFLKKLMKLSNSSQCLLAQGLLLLANLTRKYS